jgi:GMP synthase-like glutamine amidotransferase
MRVHWLQHAEHEGLGCIQPWLQTRGHTVRGTRLFDGDTPPATSDFDWLIVMGGPMNIYEHDRYPWLIAEKALIRDAFVKKKKILGICLGSQLLADVLGGRVTANRYQEIGWFDVGLTEDGAQSQWAQPFSQPFQAFHWHGDTFAIPKGSRNLLKSDACVNQAFAPGPDQLGLQFHLEVTLADAERWLAQEQLQPDRFVQSNTEILRDPERFAMNTRLMHQVLDRFDPR